MGKTAIVWLRNDLRVADNPALRAGLDRTDETIALYIHETDPGLRPIGAAARWWLHRSLESLAHDLAERGVVLEVHEGRAEAVLLERAKAHGADLVTFNRRYAPAERDLDAGIEKALKENSVETESFHAHVLVEPWDIATRQGKPFSVYSPFWKALRQHEIGQPVPTPRRSKPRAKPGTVDGAYKEPFWAGKLGRHCRIGESAAQERLDAFLESRVADYRDGRNQLFREATSRLSPHLRFGEISPRQIWHQALAFGQNHHGSSSEIEGFLSELAWRDFNYHQLYHRPDISEAPMQEKYSGMHWRRADTEFTRWTKGETGIPVVDAGMRELWETGTMHNRVRMLTASLLSKNLLIDWRRGEKWFWDCLVDGDIANNPGNWQWVAGSGLDASPFFRIFNPVTQGEKFDSEGDYVRRWVPELKDLPADAIHDPASADAGVLKKAGVELGKTYPKPIVDLKTSRERALSASRTL